MSGEALVDGKPDHGTLDVSIVIPVLNKLAFTRQCLDSIWRHTGADISFEVVIVDNASSDGTEEWFARATFPRPLRYVRNEQNIGYARANNLGAGLSRARNLLFLNNDTIARPGWLGEMLRVMRSNRGVGIVGIKQLFPYTNVVYHTGIVFTPDGLPQHLYPHLDASLPVVNQEREYQAVTGACLLIDRQLFVDCGGFDEEYVNGYEDVDLCLEARRRGRKVVCCTSGYIYHYGQISEGRTKDDDRNARRFAGKWGGRVRIDRDEYIARDGGIPAPRTPARLSVRQLPDDCIYLADDLGQGSALSWFNAELALALDRTGVPVVVNGSRLSPTLDDRVRRELKRLAAPPQPTGGVQIKWSHYWPQHLDLELAGTLNVEFFVINYLFGRPGSDAWDYWLQCVRQNGYHKLPLSEFCASVLEQIGVGPEWRNVLHPGYSPEIDDVDPPRRRDSSFRFLTVTNSHDLARYGTAVLLDAYRKAFGRADDVTLVVKDYGASSGDRTLRQAIAGFADGPRVEYVDRFTDKRTLIALYKASDAFVSSHRGEGFGMKILDAMACSLPTITPLFGGPTAYCTPENSFPVEFSLAPMRDGLDAHSLAIANEPLWAEPDVESLARQMRAVIEDRRAAADAGARARTEVEARFSWNRAAESLVEITGELRSRRVSRPKSASAPAPAERSPYWLGLRVSVVIPTRNRKEKLLAALDALAHQSILPQEFEALVIDDGSTDGTAEALSERAYPFRLRYLRQEALGPATARNMGIHEAAGELVLFIGDDIIAGERLLEDHLLAHASSVEAGLAVLGHIDWPATMPQNETMRYVCGDAALQFAYSLIPHLPSLDHRFFYTSNISLRRQFLVDAAEAGIGFDPSFRFAAFEDSEFAFRLIPRGLTIRYCPDARVVHDHWLNLDAFADREFKAGQMAVTFYRKHPSEDRQLQVREVVALAEGAPRVTPALLRDFETLDARTDALIRSTAAALERLLAAPERAAGPDASHDRGRLTLHGLLRIIFDTARTGGKIREWYSGVDDPTTVHAAQVLASVRRKMAVLATAGSIVSASPLAALAAASRVPQAFQAANGRRRLSVARILVSTGMLSKAIALDRAVQRRLYAARNQQWAVWYQAARQHIRKLIA